MKIDFSQSPTRPHPWLVWVDNVFPSERILWSDYPCPTRPGLYLVEVFDRPYIMFLFEYDKEREGISILWTQPKALYLNYTKRMLNDPRITRP